MSSIITAENLRAAIRSHANPRDALILQRFFKTGPGEYGEGDIFIGVKVPQTRAVAKAFRAAPLKEIINLLKSQIHEERLLALILLVEKYAAADEKTQEVIFTAYLRNIRYINNWDLVDISAPQIVGGHFMTRDRSILRRLATSRNLWERRIGVLATFRFIKESDFTDALAISEILLNDGHDLIHKAVGWMLREIGKRDMTVLEGFLVSRYKTMPRTMLRYTIERFSEKKRQGYLKGLI
jgi:3-methyladenine DNA glycosylase AlkD